MTDHSHHSATDHTPTDDAVTDDTVMFTSEFWDERYRSADRIWSGNPNPQLVDVASELSPGTALDVGCGEGADAIWLATRGWRVTAVDVSTVALDRAARQAAEAGTEVADRISWQPTDVLSWDLAPARFDLVTAQFMHLPRPALEALHRRLAAAVRPGGTLLIVGHHPSDLDTSIGRHGRPDLLYTAEEVAAGLAPDDWASIDSTSPARTMRDPHGELVTIHDAVLRAVRRR
jgi:SAM-dependent methyltransferase